VKKKKHRISDSRTSFGERLKPRYFDVTIVTAAKNLVHYFDCIVTLIIILKTVTFHHFPVLINK
jgi:hypothetical protein